MRLAPTVWFASINCFPKNRPEDSIRPAPVRFFPLGAAHKSRDALLCPALQWRHCFFRESFSMLAGLLLAIGACAIWGLIYIFPLILPEYNPVVIASGRFLVYGLACLAFLPVQWHVLKTFTLSDWLLALRLAFFGSLIYYCSLVMGVQLAGAPLVGMFMCWIPVLVAIVANHRSREKGAGVAWKSLIFPLSLIVSGMFVANWTEFHFVTMQGGSSGRFWLGVACAVFSMLLWTWYPIRNAEWLLKNKGKSPKVWATAQGLSVLPVTLVGFLAVSWTAEPAATGLLGPEPVKFILVMLVAGVVCSWGGAALWNAMSQRLPPALGGQMIVFETIFSVIYALIWRGDWPTPSMVIGLAMLLSGVLAALRVFRNEKV